MMVPPFELVEFGEMSKRQAQEHFDWFINEIPQRINLLMEAIEVSGEKSKDQFDLTPESLVPLWEWLKERIQSVPRSREKMDDLRKTLPSWILEHVDDRELSADTLVLATDVSLYFAEVFIQKYPKLKWGFKTKPRNDVYLNKPVVMGFTRGEMHPPTIIVNLCRWHLEGQHDKNLYSWYEFWSRFV